MNTFEGAHSDASGRAATLGDLLRRAAFAQLPSRFYGVLQVCIPLAVQLWLAGWHRMAGWCLAASSFGLWALAQQRLEGHADGPPERTATMRVSRGWRLVRRAAAVVGSLTTSLLVAEAFAQLMARVFNCPGCAG